MSLNTIVRLVSANIYPNITAHVQIETSPVNEVFIIKTPNIYPRKTLPESPMNILAGGKL